MFIRLKWDFEPTVDTMISVLKDKVLYCSIDTFLMFFLGGMYDFVFIHLIKKNVTVDSAECKFCHTWSTYIQYYQRMYVVSFYLQQWQEHL